ncbi:MAG: acyl-CoA dehydrogenase family protein [Rhodobacteraceae bacterium]|nr:acyl-CoA dehydrogenase family protein [Paracoccaceae bacterium]
MDFKHTEERQMLADTLTRYVMQDYPLAARLKAAASQTGYDAAKYAELAELGVISALFGEDFGGFGGGGFDLAVVFEAIGRGLILEPLLQSAVLAGGVLAEAGSPEQQTRLEQVISGETTASLAHFEANDGGETEWIESRAVQSTTGWQLNGAKAVVRNAATADFLVVSARSKGKIGDADGISLFLVPRETTGLGLRDYQTIDGGRAAEVTFEDVKLPLDALIGVDGKATGVLREVLGRGLLCLSAEALGIMDVIKDMTIEYLQTRNQFGMPIGKFQALQHRMAEMLLEVEQARSAVIRAAFHLDRRGLARERALSAAKVTIGRVGTLVAEEAIQLHGGIGMTWEHALGHYAKRLVMIGHQLGDEDFHLSRFIRLGREEAEEATGAEA